MNYPCEELLSLEHCGGFCDAEEHPEEAISEDTNDQTTEAMEAVLRAAGSAEGSSPNTDAERMATTVCDLLRWLTVPVGGADVDRHCRSIAIRLLVTTNALIPELSEFKTLAGTVSESVGSGCTKLPVWGFRATLHSLRRPGQPGRRRALSRCPIPKRRPPTPWPLPKLYATLVNTGWNCTLCPSTGRRKRGASHGTRHRGANSAESELLAVSN